MTQEKKLRVDTTINFSLLITLISLVVGGLWWGAWYVSEEHAARMLDHDRLVVLEQSTKQFMEQVYGLREQVAGLAVQSKENGVVLNRVATSIANHIDRDKR